MIKIIGGNYKRSEFLGKYSDNNKDKEFLLINCIESIYPCYNGKLLVCDSNYNELLEDIKEADKELKSDIIFIIFTNDSIDMSNDYMKKINSLNLDREFILVLKSISSMRIEPYIIKED